MLLTFSFPLLPFVFLWLVGRRFPGPWYVYVPEDSWSVCVCLWEPWHTMRKIRAGRPVGFLYRKWGKGLPKSARLWRSLRVRPVWFSGYGSLRKACPERSFPRPLRTGIPLRPDSIRNIVLAAWHSSAEWGRRTTPGSRSSRKGWFPVVLIVVGNLAAGPPGWLWSCGLKLLFHRFFG